ncbi:MAG: response regulator [Armatimonadota bacterium]|jgi:CheY-like chemotaxis protein
MACPTQSDQPLKILVVDDDGDILELFHCALTSRGHEVTVVDNGPDAVDIAGERSFDVGFIDVAMKPMDGLSTLSRLKAISPDTRYIMVTAFYSSELPHDVRDNILSDATRLGARGCLRKPFELATIVQTAEYFGGQAPGMPLDAGAERQRHGASARSHP